MELVSAVEIEPKRARNEASTGKIEHKLQEI